VCETLGSDNNADLFEVFGGEKVETDKTVEINILHN
jgi:hypothetical protein